MAFLAKFRTHLQWVCFWTQKTLAGLKRNVNSQHKPEKVQYLQISKVSQVSEYTARKTSQSVVCQTPFETRKSVWQVNQSSRTHLHWKSQFLQLRKPLSRSSQCLSAGSGPEVACQKIFFFESLWFFDWLWPSAAHKKLLTWYDGLFKLKKKKTTVCFSLEK